MNYLSVLEIKPLSLKWDIVSTSESKLSVDHFICQQIIENLTDFI